MCETEHPKPSLIGCACVHHVLYRFHPCP
jgi:hypothetical protein